MCQSMSLTGVRLQITARPREVMRLTTELQAQARGPWVPRLAEGDVGISRAPTAHPACSRGVCDEDVGTACTSEARLRHRMPAVALSHFRASFSPHQSPRVDRLATRTARASMTPPSGTIHSEHSPLTRNFRGYSPKAAAMHLHPLDQPCCIWFQCRGTFHTACLRIAGSCKRAGHLRRKQLLSLL